MSSSEVEAPAVLDLSGADTTGFDPIPAGTYAATVFKADMKETKGGENAKLPAGTKMINVQFRISDEEEYVNRRVFRQYVIAPAKVDGKKYEHKAMMDGMLARFFESIGYSMEEITSGNFNMDLGDFAGRECRVTLKIVTYNGEQKNEVTGVKPAQEAESGGIL